MFHRTQRSISLPQRANKESGAGWTSLEAARTPAFPQGFSASSQHARSQHPSHALCVDKIPFHLSCSQTSLGSGSEMMSPRCTVSFPAAAHQSAAHSRLCRLEPRVTWSPARHLLPPPTCTSACFSAPSSSHFSAFVIRVTAFTVCRCAAPSPLNIEIKRRRRASLWGRTKENVAWIFLPPLV